MTNYTLSQCRQIIGRRVRVIRKRQRCSVAELAARADVPAKSLKACESGLRSLTVEELERVATALRVPLADLLD